MAIEVWARVIFAGEVQTGWLRHSSAVDLGEATALLGLKKGARVCFGTRPIRYAISPDLLTGLDCQLASDKDVRGVGTVISRAILTSGHVLQSSSHVHIVRSGNGRRLPWAHYMAQPGVVETINQADAGQLEEGFLQAPAAPPTMDLGAINGRVFDRIQLTKWLDRQVPFRFGPMRVRWVVTLAKGETPALMFHAPPEGMRSMVIRLPEIERESVVSLCEDIALHDWLLCCIQKRLDATGSARLKPRQVIAELAPAARFLLHLWMPGARLKEETRAAWHRLDDVGGFTRQWHASANWIRDQLTLAAIESRPGHNPSTPG